MQPDHTATIVIGATDSIRQRMLAAHVTLLHYDTTSEAYYALRDYGWPQGDDHALQANVAYCAPSWGALLRSGAELEVTGHVLVLGEHVDGDPHRPIRTHELEPDTLPPDMLIWHVSYAAHAHHVVDIATDAGMAFLRNRYMPTEWPSILGAQPEVQP